MVGVKTDDNMHRKSPGLKTGFTEILSNIETLKSTCPTSLLHEVVSVSIDK